ncbi:histidine kinase [Paenibacillus filicis]|uniref:Histidine kinase n=1 Tax=Paenibacillus filicis TaxID=669464 RepID=A0ABU9DGJ6_9BACL
MRWYKKYIGRFLLRKLTFWVTASLLLIFVILFALTKNEFYALLEDREQQLLEVHVTQLHEHLAESIKQFERDIPVLYTLGGSDTDASPRSSIYQYLLPGQLPAEEDERSRFVEANRIRNTLSLIRDRNPGVRDVLLYRTGDGSLFHVSKYGNQEQLAADFNSRSFFAAFPRTYQFPFLGTVSGMFENQTEPFTYMAVPVFDFSNMVQDQVFGYLVATIEPQALLGKSAFAGQTPSRVVVRHEGDVLLDSAPEQATIPEQQSLYLTSSQSNDRYGLDITGYTSKDSISSALKNIQTTIVIVLTSILGLCLLLIFSIQSLAVRRIKMMTLHFNKHQKDSYLHEFPVKGEDEISQLMKQFNYMAVQLKDYIEKVYIVEFEKRNAEYYALKMQINPHFLYNTLESLRMQALVAGQASIGDQLYQLGHLYRWLLKSHDSDTVSLDEELRYTESYVDLFSMGKSNPIALEIEAGIQLSRTRVIRFILQPLVENALIHGKLEEQDEPWIQIRFEPLEDKLRIAVANNGASPTREELEVIRKRLQQAELLQASHIGILNVHYRLRSFYGGAYGVEVPSKQPEQGFDIHLYIPLPEGGITRT